VENDEIVFKIARVASWPVATVGSGITRGLSKVEKSLAEGGPLVTVGGPLANTQRKVKK